MDFNCGYKKSNKPFGTMKQCIENGRISRFGLFKADPKMLEKYYNMEKMGDKKELKKLELKLRKTTKKYTDLDIQIMKFDKEHKDTKKNEMSSKDKKTREKLVKDKKSMAEQVKEVQAEVKKLQNKIDNKGSLKDKSKKATKKKSKK